MKIGPSATDLVNRCGYHLDYPGSTLDPAREPSELFRRGRDLIRGVTFFLRPALPADAAVLADIHLRARRECMPYLPDTYSPEDVLGWTREVMPQHDEVWVAEENGRVIGFFALSDDLLYHLYVYPELHGRGCGSALFDLVKELRPNGFRLWVFQRNVQARDFYEHRGMRLVQLTDGSNNEEHEPDALYEWLPG